MSEATERRICIVKMRDGNIDGWMICAGISEAISRARWLDKSLAENLSKMEIAPLGKTDLGGGYLMLADSA